MSLLPKLKTFVSRCGPPAKFVAKAILDVAVPGSGPVLELIEKLIDCAQETAEENLETLASQQDLQRVEKMFDVMLGDLHGVVEQLRTLEHVPADARKTLTAALRTETHCLAATKVIQQQALHLSAMEAKLRRLAAGQDDLLELQRRFYASHLDYVEEQRQHNVAPDQLDDRLRRIEDFILAGGRGDHHSAETLAAEICREQPASAVLAVAEAGALAAGHDFVGAAKTLARAARLRPGDVQLAEMSRVATGISRFTPVDPRSEAKQRPRAGDTLDGWQLDQLLGYGGWGQVFLARKGALSRALKIMHAELAQDPEFVTRFKREMSLLVALGTHPHLVALDPEHLYGWAGDWGCWYYVMEFVDGITLERYLTKRGAPTLGQARALFGGIAAGLAGAHARGIIHRDIKPANILIRKQAAAGQGQGVLADFGLAGLVEQPTRGADYTATFAAPEQMRHGKSDCRSDVYSLAATICYSLLYHDVDKRGRFKAKLLPNDIPGALRALLERCLDNDPDERPRDAGAFLREWQQPLQAPIVPQPQPPDNADSWKVKIKNEGQARLHQLAYARARNLEPEVCKHEMRFILIPPATTLARGQACRYPPNLDNAAVPHFYLSDRPVARADMLRLAGGSDAPPASARIEDIDDWLRRIQKRLTPPVRLPTGAEWEHAARLGLVCPARGGELCAEGDKFFMGVRSGTADDYECIAASPFQSLDEQGGWRLVLAP